VKIWVIGGTSGIGAAVCDFIGKQDGHQVVATGLDEDVRLYGNLENFWSRHLGYDAVVYSAGVNSLMPIASLDSVDVDRIFDTNVFGFFNLLQVVANDEFERCHSVVAVSSDAAARPMRTSMAYCASKAALDMAVRCAARELAPNVRVNAVSPGMTEGTRMTEYIDRTVPSLRAGTPMRQADTSAHRSLWTGEPRSARSRMLSGTS
jgi:NAD(P)-dependent dehydrogenase (short-subunit alcohol dehydrogenase family)